MHRIDEFDTYMTVPESLTLQEVKDFLAANREKLNICPANGKCNIDSGLCMYTSGNGSIDFTDSRVNRDLILDSMTATHGAVRYSKLQVWQ